MTVDHRCRGTRSNRITESIYLGLPDLWLQHGRRHGPLADPMSSFIGNPTSRTRPVLLSAMLLGHTGRGWDCFRGNPWRSSFVFPGVLVQPAILV